MRKILNHKKIIVLLIAIIVATGILSWRGRAGTQQSYQTVRAERGTIISQVSASGNVLTSNIINITTTASGMVEEVYVKDGDTVAAGQKIAEITLDMPGQQKNAAAWASYLSAKNTVDLASVTFYSLQSDLFSKWKKFFDLATSSTYQNADGSPKTENRILSEFTIAQADWLAAEGKYKNQQGVLDQAKAALSSNWLLYQAASPVITAPIAGTVSNVGLVEGLVLETSITPRMVAVIQNTAPAIISVNLSEVDVVKVKIGQKATITLDGAPGKTFTGTLQSIDKIGVVSSGVTNYPVLVRLEAIVEEILPNMAATANIQLASQSEALIIPTSAIQTSPERKSIVRILKNGQVQVVPVETGLASDSQTEIKSGLQDGDEVITGTLGNNRQTSGAGGRSPFSTFGGGRGGLQH